LQRLLARFGVLGGIAASLLGKPRLTADVDAMILLSMDDLPDLIEAATRVGSVPRLTDAEDFARRQRFLLLRHQESGINVDIETHPHPDRKRIQHWVREFARLLEMPELWDDIAIWLT